MKELDSTGSTEASSGPGRAGAEEQQCDNADFNSTDGADEDGAGHGLYTWDTAAAAISSTGISLTESIKGWFPADSAQYNASLTQRLDVDAVMGVLHQVRTLPRGGLQ